MSPTVYVTSVCVCLKSFTARRLWCVCVCVSMGRWWEASSGPWERLPWWRLLVSVMLPWQQWPQQGTGLQGSLKPICPAHTHTFIEWVTVRMSFAILVFALLLRCFTTRCSETHTHAVSFTVVCLYQHWLSTFLWGQASLLPFIIYLVLGVCSNHWMRNSSCSSCLISLITSCWGDNMFWTIM